MISPSVETKATFGPPVPRSTARTYLVPSAAMFSPPILPYSLRCQGCGVHSAGPKPGQGNGAEDRGRLTGWLRETHRDGRHCWLPSEDSNLDQRLQRPLCYRYTTRQPGSPTPTHKPGGAFCVPPAATEAWCRRPGSNRHGG